MRQALFACCVSAWSITCGQAALIYSQDFESLANGVLAGQAGFNENNEVIKVDNIRIGTTFIDVMPEPSSALLGLGGLTSMALRRRRVS